MTFITHREGRPVPASLFVYQCLENALYGAAVGALGAKIFKGYSLQTGAAMGLCARVARVIPDRLLFNSAFGETEEAAHVCLALCSYAPVLLAPLVARLGSFPVTALTVGRYWVQTAGISVLFLGLKHGLIYPAIGKRNVNYTIEEWLTRPPIPSGPVCLSDANIQVAPQLPQFQDPANLQTIPTLAEQARSLGVREVTTMEPSNPGPDGSVIDQEYYKLVRNLAYQIAYLPDDESKRLALEEARHAFDHCATRRITACYDLAAALHSQQGGFEAKTGMKIAIEAHAIKRQIFLDYAQEQGMKACDTTHLWAAMTEGCGEVLGLIHGDVNPEDAFVRMNGGANDALGVWFARVSLTPSRSNFQGANKWYWARAVRARYRAADPSLLIDRVQGTLNLDPVLAGQNMGRIAEYLEDKGAKGPTGQELDSDDMLESNGLVTKLYCQPRASGTGYELNEEGTILLLKLTGDLVNDGRLHTQLSNAQVLDPTQD